MEFRTLEISVHHQSGTPGQEKEKRERMQVFIDPSDWENNPKVLVSAEAVNKLSQKAKEASTRLAALEQLLASNRAAYLKDLTSLRSHVETLRSVAESAGIKNFPTEEALLMRLRAAMEANQVFFFDPVDLFVDEHTRESMKSFFALAHRRLLDDNASLRKRLASLGVKSDEISPQSVSPHEFLIARIGVLLKTSKISDILTCLVENSQNSEASIRRWLLSRRPPLKEASSQVSLPRPCLAVVPAGPAVTLRPSDASLAPNFTKFPVLSVQKSLTFIRDPAPLPLAAVKPQPPPSAGPAAQPPKPEVKTPVPGEAAQAVTTKLPRGQAAVAKAKAERPGPQPARPGKTPQAAKVEQRPDAPRSVPPAEETRQRPEVQEPVQSRESPDIHISDPEDVPVASVFEQAVERPLTHETLEAAESPSHLSQPETQDPVQVVEVEPGLPMTSEASSQTEGVEAGLASSAEAASSTGPRVSVTSRSTAAVAVPDAAEAVDRVPVATPAAAPQRAADSRASSDSGSRVQPRLELERSPPVVVERTEDPAAWPMQERETHRQLLISGSQDERTTSGGFDLRQFTMETADSIFGTSEEFGRSTEISSFFWTSEADTWSRGRRGGEEELAIGGSPVQMTKRGGKRRRGRATIEGEFRRIPDSPLMTVISKSKTPEEVRRRRLRIKS